MELEHISLTISFQSVIMTRTTSLFLFIHLLHAAYASPLDPVVTSVPVISASTPPPAASLTSNPTPATSLLYKPTISAIPEGPPASIAKNYTTLEIYAGPAGPQATQTAGFCNATAPPATKKTVAYFVTDHGNAVIDGDIIFGTEAQLLAAAVNSSIHKRAFSEISTSPKKWPGGVVYYKWDAGLPDTHKNYFLAGATEWTNRLPFLKFQYDPTDSSGIARTVKVGSGNSSPIGCCGGDIELCPDCNPRSARHEIGHSEFHNVHPIQGLRSLTKTFPQLSVYTTSINDRIAILTSTSSATPALVAL